MGNLFDLFRDTTVQTANYPTRTNYNIVTNESNSNNRIYEYTLEQQRRLQRGLNNENYGVPNYRTSQRISVPKIYNEPKLINPRRSVLGITHSMESTYSLIPTSEYNIKHIIKCKNMIIDSVIKINNPCLKLCYELKKAQLQEYVLRDNWQEVWLFHGTKEKNVHSICMYNFDWRKNGEGTGHKYGQGVSFSDKASYASNYSNQTKPKKVMILATVLINRSCVGNKFTSYPPDGYDTTTKNQDDKVVVVKYDDNTFYPSYIINYHFKNNALVSPYANLGYKKSRRFTE